MDQHIAFYDTEERSHTRCLTNFISFIQPSFVVALMDFDFCKRNAVGVRKCLVISAGTTVNTPVPLSPLNSWALRNQIERSLSARKFRIFTANLYVWSAQPVDCGLLVDRELIVRNVGKNEDVLSTMASNQSYFYEEGLWCVLVVRQRKKDFVALLLQARTRVCDVDIGTIVLVRLFAWKVDFWSKKLATLL